MNTASPFRKPKYSKPHHLYSHIFISRMCLSLLGLLPSLMGLIRTPAEAPILSPSLQDPCCFLRFSLACSWSSGISSQATEPCGGGVRGLSEPWQTCAIALVWAKPLRKHKVIPTNRCLCYPEGWVTNHCHLSFSFVSRGHEPLSRQSMWFFFL